MRSGLCFFNWLEEKISVYCKIRLPIDVNLCDTSGILLMILIESMEIEEKIFNLIF